MEWKWERAGKKIDVPLNEYLDKLITETKAKGFQMQVSVGTDSQRDGRVYKFATVILITLKRDLGGGVIVGEGGMMITSVYKLPTYSRNKEGVNERMLIEVGKSIEIAYEIAPLLDSHNLKLEIHADINPNPKWESNKALSQAIGYILGMGYNFKIKPDAWAASFGGNKFCH